MSYIILICTVPAEVISSMDLPVVLETMLRTIATKHNVNSWSIYPEKDKIVTFKIKFACSEETAMPQHYKKKSISQLKRDNTRASVWFKRIFIQDSQQAYSLRVVLHKHKILQNFPYKYS